MDLIITWIMTFIVTQAPVNRPLPMAARETPEDATARYGAIAKDIAEVVYDPTEAPVFKGPLGRLKTAAVIQSIMMYESSFKRDVDLGAGTMARGDHGASWCMMQILLSPPKKDGSTQTRILLDSQGGFSYAYDGVSGLGGDDLIHDRKSCIRAGLHIMRASFRACQNSPALHSLAVYASGSCEKGLPQSEQRMGLAMRWFATHRPGFVDADVLNRPVAVMYWSTASTALQTLSPL